MSRRTPQARTPLHCPELCWSRAVLWLTRLWCWLDTAKPETQRRIQNKFSIYSSYPSTCAVCKLTYLYSVHTVCLFIMAPQTCLSNGAITIRKRPIPVCDRGCAKANPVLSTLMGYVLAPVWLALFVSLTTLLIATTSTSWTRWTQSYVVSDRLKSKHLSDHLK